MNAPRIVTYSIEKAKQVVIVLADDLGMNAR